jgi:hypothetical protein
LSQTIKRTHSDSIARSLYIEGRGNIAWASDTDAVIVGESTWKSSLQKNSMVRGDHYRYGREDRTIGK